MATVEEAVLAEYGERFVYRESAIDSLRWSLQTGRPADEAIRGLANATSPGPLAPTEREMIAAERCYRMVA